MQAAFARICGAALLALLPLGPAPAAATPDLLSSALAPGAGGFDLVGSIRPS